MGRPGCGDVDPRARILDAGPSFSASARRLGARTRRKGAPCDCISLSFSTLNACLDPDTRRPLRRPGNGRVVDPDHGRFLRRMSCSSPHGASDPNSRDERARASSRWSRRTQDATSCASPPTVSAPNRWPTRRQQQRATSAAIALAISAVSETLVVSAAQVEIPRSSAAVGGLGDPARRSCAIDKLIDASQMRCAQVPG